MTAQEYLTEHQINETSIKRFHITWDDNQVNIPIKNKEDQIIWVKHRNLNYTPDDPNSKKYINDLGSKVSLFNIRSHHNKKDLILTEGEMDAIKLDQEGIPAISNTGGAGSFNKELAEQIANKNIYICYDNDKPGTEGIKKVLDFLPTAKIIELPQYSHDVCDFFTLHTKKDFVEVLKQAKTKEQWAIKYQSQDYATLTITELYKREYPPESWIIDKFLPITGITMFSGDSGVGKSWLALEVVRAITNNDIFLDHFEIKTPNVPILIIDKENGLRRLQSRMKGMSVPPTDNVYLLEFPEKFTLDDAEFMQSVQNCIIANKIGIVIVDSFIDVMLGNENDAVETSRVFAALRSISTNVCWILIHHETKPQPKFTPQAGDRARGSTNIKAQLDYLFSMQRTKQLKVINIEQGKARDYEMIPKFAVEFVTIEETGEMSGFKYLGEVQSENSKVDEAMDFIEEYLSQSPHKTVQDIVDSAEGVGIIKSSISRALKSLKEKNVVDFIKGLNGTDKRKSFYFLSRAENIVIEGLTEGSEGEQFLNSTLPLYDTIEDNE